MIDFSKYVAKSNSNSNFLNTTTIEEVKASQAGAVFNVIPSKEKPGKFFFACGVIRGHVAAKTAEKLDWNHKHPNDLKPIGTMVVSEIMTADGNTLLSLHEQGSNSNVVAAF